MLDKMYARIWSFTDEHFLAESPIWLNWQKSKHDQETAQISEHFVDLLDAAERLYELPSEERSAYLEQHPELALILKPLRYCQKLCFCGLSTPSDFSPMQPVL
jgi:hypothetical protein